MSKDITEFIKSELYPALYERIDIAFPEHNFIKEPNKWRSATYLNGAPHKRGDKTVVTNKAQGYIMEQGGETKSLVDYVMERDNVDFIQAVNTLCNVVDMALPSGEFSAEYYKKYKEKNTILELACNYFTWCLNSSDSPGAKTTNSYLESRGYSLEDIETMELGYIPSREQLFSYLESKGHSKEAIKEALNLNVLIGDSHKLAIPYRSSGTIKGFTFRSLDNSKNKYINSTGLIKSETFFNIKASKGEADFIIVEGFLDALIAEARGVENVVALGGVSITAEQIKHAISKGAKKFTICLDSDATGQSNTDKAIEAILKQGISRIYVASLTGSIEQNIDPDTLITQQGVEAFKQAIIEAIPYYEYKLDYIRNKYAKIQELRPLESKDIDNFLEDIINTAATINSPIDRDKFKKLFISLSEIQELGITEESLTIIVDKITSTKEREAKKEALRKLLTRATEIQDKGEVNEAVDLLEKTLKQVKLKDKATEYSKLLLTTTELEIKEEEASLPDSLKTGYSIKGQELLISGGALSVIAAPTNHGKTAMLVNLALNAADLYPEKKFVFFTYEERANSIIQYFLNTYINKPLNNSATSNRRLIKDYFKGNSQYINKAIFSEFEESKNTFFKTYIETGRINVKYIDLKAEELTSAIDFISKEEPNLGGIFIDYFQLISLTKTNKSRQEELKEICLLLKNSAVSTGQPLILAAQFNREVTNLMRLHPTNIREAGDIENIVHTLVGLWNMHKKPLLNAITNSEKDEILNRTAGVEQGMYLEILKSRDIATGAYELLDYNGNTGKIEPNNYYDNSIINTI